MDIQATKLELMQLLLNTEEEHVLTKVKAAFEEETDFWDELSQEDKDAIDEGIAQLDRGESVSREEADRIVKEKLNFS